MKHEALSELFLIINEPKLEIRKALLEAWEEKWIHYTEKTQYVINKSILNSEELDFVWYKVAQMCAEDLIDSNITKNSTTNTSFSCELWSLRSPYAKFQKNTKDLKKIG